jgi:hypothetical protein
LKGSRSQCTLGLAETILEGTNLEFPGCHKGRHVELAGLGERGVGALDSEGSCILDLDALSVAGGGLSDLVSSGLALLERLWRCFCHFVVKRRGASGLMLGPSCQGQRRFLGARIKQSKKETGDAEPRLGKRDIFRDMDYFDEF